MTLLTNNFYKSKLINQTFELDTNTNIGSGFNPEQITVLKPTHITECNIFFDRNLSFNCFINFPNYLTQATFSTYFDTSEFVAKYANCSDLDEEMKEILQGISSLDALYNDREKRIETKRILSNKCLCWMKKKLESLGITKNSKRHMTNELFTYIMRNAEST